MSNAQAMSAIRHTTKKRGLDCKIIRIGTAKNFDIGLHGADSREIADLLIRRGLTETPMSGTGTRNNPITVTA